MFTNDSNTSLVMVGSPYRLNHAAADAYKPATTVPFGQLDPRLAPHPQPEYYLHQQRTIEIIELEEVPPPSRRERISVPSTSYASTSYASSSTSDEEEEEAATESYCSSEEVSEEESSEDEEPVPAHVAADSFHSRMRRIEQWRDAYAKAVGAQFAPSPPRSKRKCETGDEDDDTLSHSSKRSRHGSFTGSASTSASVCSVHSCSACDAWFPDRGSLRKHGFSPRTSEACRAAVEYECEQ